MTSIFLPVGHLQQRKTGECLAACAFMALDFVDIRASYNRLLRILNVQPDYGAPSSNIRNLSRLGVSVEYRRGTLDGLKEHLLNGQPPIVFLQTRELPYWDRATEHAAVVVGMDDEYVYMNDPEFSIAPAKATHGDFGLAWLEHDEYYATLVV